MIDIQGFDHVGIRVTDIECALDFYKQLGFFPSPEERFPEHRATGIVNRAGIRINLIEGAEKNVNNKNILIDERRKYPGVTHVAFVVDKIDDVLRDMEATKIPITEGPIEIGGRRTVCFVRDPDGNVIEFNQLAEIEMTLMR